MYQGYSNFFMVKFPELTWLRSAVQVHVTVQIVYVLHYVAQLYPFK